MKKVIFFIAVLVISGSTFARPAGISEKAISAFKSTFTGASNVVWMDAQNYSLVRFTLNGITTRVTYDADGNFVSSRRFYGADQLPVDIQCQLKKKYPGKSIFGITELASADAINYYVKMQDNNSWTTVRVDGERNMDITEQYKKL